MSNPLEKELAKISEKCINCDLCQKECEFLRRHGNPKEIADNFRLSSKADAVIPYECSLCRLCSVVCPVDLNPADMFLEMRRRAVDLGIGPLPEHKGMLAYQMRGISRRYTWYGLPKGCDTVFFPGCSLPGTRPESTFKIFQYLENRIPSLGVVLDCCVKTSHDLGQDKFFRAMFGEMKSYLIENGIKNILTACPNCHRVFISYGDGLKIKSILEVISQNDIPENKLQGGIITIHDPCAVRFEKGIQNNVRQVIARQGLVVEEMDHSKEKTFCCGEGAGVSCISPELAENWGSLRKIEANGRVVVTYCAGCENYLGKKSAILHVLDLLFDPKTVTKGRSRVPKAPITYWNRLRLKKRLKKYLNFHVSRERAFSYKKVGGGTV